MAPVLKIGSRVLDATEVIPLLAQYQLLTHLCRDIAIDQAISHVSCTSEELEQVRQKFFETHKIATLDAEQKWKKQMGLTTEQLEHLATRSFRLERFKQEKWGSKLEHYFLARKAQLDQVVYSLIRTSSSEIARELYFRIQSNEMTFAEAAQQFGKGPEAFTGGRFGPVLITRPHPTLAEKLAQAAPGQLFPPFVLEGWHVVTRLEQRLPARLDEQTRQKLLDELLNDWLEPQLSTVQIFGVHSTTPVSKQIVSSPLLANRV
jgi:parvulin-like peptidyl-prolyl isomerase